MTLHRPALAAIACLAMAGAPARADMIDIAWDAAGRFEHRVVVAPGQFAEACGRLDRGQAVRWSYEAAGPLDFNIHYHQGRRVAFPVKRAGVARAGGALKVRLDQDYCWMWTNKSARPQSLRMTLAR